MVHSEIYAFLRDVTGIDVSSIGEEMVNRVVNGRMKANGYDGVGSYFSYLKTSTTERQFLINEITVQETWFFRDNEPFKLFYDYVTKVWSPSPGQKLKVLSIPCSTGEEPYSIAMVLLDAGFARDSFIIDAADISTRALDLAKRGVYGKNSFRGGDFSFHDKYFTEKAGFFELSDEIKGAVSFHHQNVLASDFMQGRDPYNVIFCRNLLIYFDLETKERVIRSLRNLMFSDGLLFLGHAETGRMVHGLFESMRHSGAFAYQPAGLGRKIPPRNANATAAAAVTVPTKASAGESQGNNEIAADFVVGDSPVQAEQRNHVSLAEIQMLADRGDLQTAMQVCDLYIQRNPVVADGYYLQGIIFLAEDEDEKALSSFKRAVYLEPNHYQSLAHLAVLAEEMGEFQVAANYRARVERAKAKF